MTKPKSLRSICFFAILTLIFTLVAASRVVELFSENIPATFIQISAIIDLIKGSESPSMVSIGSLLITLLSAGMISAQISFDMDVEPLGRLEVRRREEQTDELRGRVCYHSSVHRLHHRF